ncbi:hypothetical protein LCGC14_0643760 [marine sediment metagenome]|uniref:Radical SAM core domain-containing protein n=1 Tax=marine sediment metagenome TaxID=412755 RepID=A0A0F9QYJ5_9ZZZZ|nr:radical SAM protein [Pricia sp.]
MAKSALITFGNEESYGLSFVGGELLDYKQDIRFFESRENWLDIVKWKPDFLMFSPLMTFFDKAIELAHRLKMALPKSTVVFGGHHVTADDNVLSHKEIDIVVKGPVRNSMPQILDGYRGVIETLPGTPSDLPKPARNEYFRDIPRIANRYRKFVLSMLGCQWNCSYCSSSSGHIKEMFGNEVLRNYYLERRPVEDVLVEVSEIMKYDTKEIEWVDDDVFYGDERWMLEFLDRKPKVPMYVSCTSHSAIKVSGKLLKRMRNHVNVIGMGIQAIRSDSLKLFNRSWDYEVKMKTAYDRLTKYGYRVNLQAIVGLPIDDPVEDAIDTVLGLQRIGKGSICSIYPLMIYPGTELAMKGYELQDCNGDTNSAMGSIKFDTETNKRLFNICKLGTFFVKYNIDEDLIRALINIDFDPETSEKLSMLRYRECVVDRLGKTGKEIFSDILKETKFKF